ncbi:MAG: S16 family serine protease [Desulfobacterales bacterium]
MDQEESQVGLATGLAWTSVGGEVLYIEATLLEGKGDLIITGQIGEVMQESARAVVSYTGPIVPILAFPGIILKILIFISTFRPELFRKTAFQALPWQPL